jgi:phosphatidylglycerol---prolipoprotein diacylglyceryl transferase
MIPYFEQPSLGLGPITIYSFGLLVAAGILTGLAVARRRARDLGLDPAFVGQLVAWIVVGGFLGAHLADRLLYNFGETWRDPLSLLRIWEGISSYGGFFGAIAGGWLLLRHHAPDHARWRYVDVAAYGLPFGWFLGRLGCFVAYDHVGVPTTALVGQTYVDGLVRYNLGLLEAIFTLLVLIPFVVIVGRREPRPGVLAGGLAVVYAAGRFLLDFLRVDDERYLGLIASQYASLALFALGAAVLWRSLRRPGAHPLPAGA